MIVLAKETKEPNTDKLSSKRLKSDTHTEKRPRTAFSVWTKINSLPDVRKQKVLDIRRQLEEGTYNLDKYLDASLSEVLNDLRR